MILKYIVGVICARQVFSLAIDTRSCIDVISEEIVKRLGLKVKPHLSLPKLQVTQRCLVPFSLANLEKLLDVMFCPLRFARSS